MDAGVVAGELTGLPEGATGGGWAAGDGTGGGTATGDNGGTGSSVVVDTEVVALTVVLVVVVVVVEVVISSGMVNDIPLTPVSSYTKSTFLKQLVPHNGFDRRLTKLESPAADV